MADIQSTAAEIRRGKKEEDRRKKEEGKKLQGKKIMAALLHRAAITRRCFSSSTLFTRHSYTVCYIIPQILLSARFRSVLFGGQRLRTNEVQRFLL